MSAPQYTLTVQVEVEVRMDLDDLDWFCDPITGEPDIDIIANHMEATLSKGSVPHETYNLRVAKAATAPVKY